MYLKSLEITGFKSFARKTTLKFNQSITAIVGPNGSGKSNIADALRWVMGEQSIKTLRGKKSEDVIFSGSDKKSRLGMAEVSLKLDNSDHQAPIDYSELVITRRIFRNGESEYLINNHKTRLSDINLLLTQANFGHRTYSVIGQGMIDNFLISTPQERKEFFEEATGVKQYQIKKQHGLKKLASVWQNINTLKIKLNEIQPRLKLLTKQVNKLKKRQLLENELNQLKIKYYSSLWFEVELAYKQQDNKLKQLTQQQQVIKEKFSQLEKQLNQNLKNNHTLDKIKSLRQTEKDILDKKIKLKEELFKLKFKLESQLPKNHESLIKISPVELKAIEQNLTHINNLVNKLLDLPPQKISADLIKKTFASIKNKINLSLKIFQPSTKEQTTATKPELKAEQEKIKLFEQELKTLDIQLNELQQKIKNIENEDNQNRAKLWKLQTNYNQSQQTLNHINSDINNLRIELARIETKKFDLKQEIIKELDDLKNLNKEYFTNLNPTEKNELNHKIIKLNHQLEIIGGIDPEIEKEFEETSTRYNFLSGQLNDLEQTSQNLKKLINELNEIIKQQVKKSYQEINKYFQKYFKILFNGGHAELILIKKDYSQQEQISTNQNQGENEETAINFFQEKNKHSSFSGIEIHATPPGKKLKSIHALSGGERALTSIALICAIITSNPAPFVLLDEVDAALDEANSIRFAEILKELSHKTQFIVITHNRTTMQSAKLLYGVTIGEDGISKLLSIKLEDVEKYNLNNKK